MAPRSCMSHEAHRKLAELRRSIFFFFRDQLKIRKKDAFVSMMTFFFEITFKPDKKTRKIFSTNRGRLNSCSIFTLSLAHSHISGIFARGENLEGTLTLTQTYECTGNKKLKISENE